jgi:hypothetical protein
MKSKTLKSVTGLLLVFAFVFLAVPATQALTSPSLSGMQIYPKDHIWNVPVDKLPVDHNSATYIKSAGASAYLYVYQAYHLNKVDSSTPEKYFTFRYPSDRGPYPIPSNPLIETQSEDHSLLIVQPDTNYFYQIFDAQKNADGTWSAGSGAVFDLSTYELRPDSWTADAAGLPMLPGLLRYEEVASGEINHALRITTWTTQNAHIWPARHHSGISNTAFPPMGQRFRLKASVDISGYTPQQQVILKAMKKYGMILADNNGNKAIWGLSATDDSRWDFGYSSFAGIQGSDFEAVDESSLMIDEDSGKARVTSGSIASTTNPSITITSPSGGETWTRGTTKTITWSYTGSPGSTVEIDLVKGGTTVGTIANSVPTGSGGKGSYSWPISSTVTTGSDYRVSVQSTSQTAIKDISSNYFTLTSGSTISTTSTPSITVTSPAGGETWTRGTTKTITWSYTGSPGSTVDIDLLKGGLKVGTIADSVPIGSGGQGSYSWPITSTATATTGDDYKVSVQSTSQPAIKDTSTGYFTIVFGTTTSGTTAPSITVTSPNGGEVWYKYTTRTITWSYTGSAGSTVDIDLIKGGLKVGTIADSIPIGSSGKGSYSWFVGSNWLSDNDYKISVQSTSQPTIKDMNNANFIICWS